MTKTILITGTSSGYGKAIAEHFLSHGWNVIATMRRPDDASFSGDTTRLRVLPLDVTSGTSIAALIEVAGPIDVLVNNAGVGAVGAFEVTPMSLVRAHRDQHDRRNGHVPGGHTTNARASFGHDRQRHVERHAWHVPPGGCLHGQQAGDRRLHRLACT